MEDKNNANVAMLDLQQLNKNLKDTVYFLCEGIGPRHFSNTLALDNTAMFISEKLKMFGYEVKYQEYEFNKSVYKNVYAVLNGTKSAEDVLVIGAHYDTIKDSPGADDNASAVAVLLELARIFSNIPQKRTIHFVAFTLEEPPVFGTSFMGSYMYAHYLKKQGVAVMGMICLEMLGYFTEEPESQFYPLYFLRWIFPKTGNYIAFVGNRNSKDLIELAKSGFKKATPLPVESICMVKSIPGVTFSDHRSFWKLGYKAIMVTDTAFYRNPHYHTHSDTADKLDYERMAHVVAGLVSSITELANKELADSLSS
ncbi:MAG: M28 family peptidase [Candidatus Magnetoovum sp. WYHC-5]|nr:M28 family peptidase [Candidatus Magnetoovum sp. WYHC-5]